MQKFYSFNEILCAHRSEENLDLFTVYAEDSRELGVINGNRRTFQPHPDPQNQLDHIQVYELESLMETCYYVVNPDMHPNYESQFEQ